MTAVSSIKRWRPGVWAGHVTWWPLQGSGTGSVLVLSLYILCFTLLGFFSPSPWKQGYPPAEQETMGSRDEQLNASRIANSAGDCRCMSKPSQDKRNEPAEPQPWQTHRIISQINGYCFKPLTLGWFITQQKPCVIDTSSIIAKVSFSI